MTGHPVGVGTPSGPEEGATCRNETRNDSRRRPCLGDPATQGGGSTEPKKVCARTFSLPATNDRTTLVSRTLGLQCRRPPTAPCTVCFRVSPVRSSVSVGRSHPHLGSRDRWTGSGKEEHRRLKVRRGRTLFGGCGTEPVLFFGLIQRSK